MNDDLLDRYIRSLLLKRIREGDDGEGGEGKFGSVPWTDPNFLLNTSTFQDNHSLDSDLLLKEHPLLSKSQQFSGIDPRLTANPAENTTAQELYPQHRLTHSYALKNSQRQRKTPKLSS